MKIVFSNLMAASSGALLLVACSPADSNGTTETDGENAVVATNDEIGVPTPVAETFPFNFRGNWDYNENGCGEGESGTKFRITENAIIGYEDTSTLKSIEVLDELSIRVALENESADGSVIQVQTMRLSPVAGISMRIENGGETIRTLRCDPV